MKLELDIEFKKLYEKYEEFKKLIKFGQKEFFWYHTHSFLQKKKPSIVKRV